MDFNEWTQNAINRIATHVNFNQRFELKDLFEGCEWDRLSKGERISFGKYFANEVRENRIPGVQALERGKNNHSRYTKILTEDYGDEAIKL